MTPIQTIYTYLQDAGLFGDWIGPGGNTQPAPEIQMRALEEEAVPSDKRVLLIKASGGGGNRFLLTPVFLFAIMGKVGESPAYAEAYAELVYNALLHFDRADCIIGIEPLGSIGGAYKMQSGRYAYDMEFVADVDSGLLF